MYYSNSQLCSNILQEIMEAKGTWWERYFQFWNRYYGMEWIYKKIPFWWPGRIESKLLNVFCQYLKDNYVIIKKMADLSRMKHSPTPISFFSRENHLWRERDSKRMHLDFWPLKSFHMALSQASLVKMMVLAGSHLKTHMSFRAIYQPSLVRFFRALSCAQYPSISF